MSASPSSGQSHSSLDIPHDEIEKSVKDVIRRIMEGEWFPKDTPPSSSSKKAPSRVLKHPPVKGFPKIKKWSPKVPQAYYAMVKEETPEQSPVQRVDEVLNIEDE